MSKYTFAEFTAALEGDDFNVIEPNLLEWATKFIESMGKAGSLVHHGDCTHHAISCLLCAYERMLSEYHTYYFSPKLYDQDSSLITKEEDENTTS